MGNFLPRGVDLSNSFLGEKENLTGFSKLKSNHQPMTPSVLSGIWKITLSWVGFSILWRKVSIICLCIMILLLLYGMLSHRLYFDYLLSRWDELAQYEPLSEFPIEVASIVVKQQSRQHTYQFLMDLKSEFDPLRIHILNTSPMPSLYEPFATIDGEE
ncbi:hypothetical protein RHGRI_007420 [Rhododendron griersonianum]|uniref:Uncharacterized protein n=1 Tax=Rhododendron griersonianum TaxID=479676 RepID=A0AAV6KYF3_9ERIC|nr:hypothetical protein RHGRI_007420 [Rhododendron griersonianum]